MIHICIPVLGSTERVDEMLTSPAFYEDVEDHGASVNVLLQACTGKPPAYTAFLFKLALIEEPRNLGGAGAKKALVEALGLTFDDIVIILDEDIKVTRAGWIATLIKPLDESPVGVSGTEGMKLRSNFLTRYLKDGEKPDYVSGGRIAVLADVFLTGCQFDEQFFPVYYDDVDFCLQAREAGYEIATCEETGLLHEAEFSAEKAGYFRANRQRLINKWKGSTDAEKT